MSQGQNAMANPVPVQGGYHPPRAVSSPVAQPTRDVVFLMFNGGKLWLDVNSIESISFEESGTFFTKVQTRMGEAHWVSETREEIADMFQSVAERLAW